MEENKLDRRKITLIVLGVAILIVLVVGITYAFFQNQIGEPASGNVGVDTDTPDNLQFNVSNDISININQFNFGPDAGNQSDDAVASAKLLANSTNDTATYTYYVYFKINNNNYVYTTDDQKPEIILTVTDPTGAPVTEVEGLTYNQELGGFDITTANGTFAVASAYTITSNSSVTPTTQNWQFSATFINLDTDQGENAGKKMDAEIIIQQDELQTLVQYVISQYTGTDGENALYYHDADLANGAQDNSYRYAGANPNNYVCFGSIETPCPAENLYRIIGVLNDNGEYQVKLIKSDYTTSAMLGTDGRDYYGSYVDSQGESSNYKGNMTQSDIAAYRWNYDESVSNINGSNNWTTSEFNTINLNTNYWNYLGATWQNLIAPTTWHLGGVTSVINTAKAFYDGERNNAGYGSNPTTYTDEIGLMYVSDYGYAAYSDAWTTDLSSYSNSTITSNNWLYMGLYEWTITPFSRDSSIVFHLDRNGYLFGYSAAYDYSVRPVFYLNSNVEYNGGTGTESDPFTLVV